MVILIEMIYWGWLTINFKWIRIKGNYNKQSHDRIVTHEITFYLPKIPHRNNKSSSSFKKLKYLQLKLLIIMLFTQNVTLTSETE